MLEKRFMMEKFFTFIKQEYKWFILLILLIGLLVLNINFYYKSFNNDNKEKQKVNNVFEVDVTTKDNYVFLGDSITEFYPLEELYDNLPVINSGISGNTTDDILNNMKGRVYDYNPTKVFLLIGTNDIEKDKTEKDIIENIKKIITEIKKEKPHAKIYLESIYPVNESDDEKIDKNTVGKRTNETIKNINKELKTYCENGECTYIDMYSELVDSSDNLELKYTKEGLHISDLGYLKITRILLPYLND